MNKADRGQQIYSTVKAMAAEMPEVAIQGLLSGMEEKMQSLRDELATKDAAFLSALALAKDGRLTVDTKNELNNIIVSAINQKNMCELEKSMVEVTGKGFTAVPEEAFASADRHDGPTRICVSGNLNNE